MFTHKLLRVSAHLVLCCLLALVTGCAGLAVQTANAGLDTESAQPMDVNPGSSSQALVWQTRFEDGFVYAVGLGHLPKGDPGTAEGWARAKRAALDNAMANLLVEARRLEESALTSSSPSTGQPEPRRALLADFRGAVKQAERVNVIRFRNGECRVLMRMPFASTRDGK